MLELFRHLATLPSRKSNISPARGKASAMYRSRLSFEMRYRAEEKTDWEPHIPLEIVTRSASRKLLEDGEG